MADVISQSLARRRFALTLVGAFAATALLLAGLGIYGVTAYSVGQRAQEIGLRMAIGAGRRDILQLIVGKGLRVITAGIAVGLIGAALLTRLLTSLLFGATPTDPVTYVVVSSVLAVVALLACYVPATRALRIDPVVALRAE
jgi:ABC-type antimicrobial peptide transport system permease subunit